MDAAKARNFLGLLSIVLASAYFAMFHLDLNSGTVVVFLKLVSAGVLPGLLCFSWLYFWADAADPFKYLSVWNSCTQALFLAVNLLRIPAASWGVFGWAYIGLSVVVIAFYLTRFHDTRWGFFALGGLILVNVALAFALTLTTYSLTHPVIAASEREAVRYLGVFISELAVMGALLTSSSQLYWHDVLGKRQEQAMVEGVFKQLEEEATKMSPDNVAKA